MQKIKISISFLFATVFLFSIIICQLLKDVLICTVNTMLDAYLTLFRMFGLKNVQTWNNKTNLFGSKVIVLKCDEIIHEELGMFGMERTIILRECRYYSHLFVESYFCALQT